MSGGRSAIDGFAAQTLVAIIKALARNDWTAMEVDPEDPGDREALQKVDVEFKRGTDAVLHIQVKRSINSFSARRAHAWAEALSNSGKAPEKELILVGRGTGDDSKHGVKITFMPGEEADLIDICCTRISKLLNDHQRPSPSMDFAAEVAERVWERAFLCSRKEHQWTRADLVALFLDLATPPTPKPTGLRVKCQRSPRSAHNRCFPRDAITGASRRVTTGASRGPRLVVLTAALGRR